MYLNLDRYVYKVLQRCDEMKSHGSKELRLRNCAQREGKRMKCTEGHCDKF